MASAPDRQPLTELTDPELVCAIITEVNRRDTFAAVRPHLLSLLAVGPALSASEDIGDTEPAHTAVTIDTRSRLLNQHMLTSTEISQHLTHNPTAKHRSTASRLRALGMIIGVKVTNRYLFPAWQFDRARAQIHPVVAHINPQLSSATQPWDALAWWQTPHDHGTRIDLIGDHDTTLMTLIDQSHPGSRR